METLYKGKGEKINYEEENGVYIEPFEEVFAKADGDTYGERGSYTASNTLDNVF